jgi:hypothetical protein
MGAMWLAGRHSRRGACHRQRAGRQRQVSHNGGSLSRGGRSLPANASGVDTHRDSITGRGERSSFAGRLLGLVIRAYFAATWPLTMGALVRIYFTFRHQDFLFPGEDDSTPPPPLLHPVPSFHIETCARLLRARLHTGAGADHGIAQML